MGSWAGCGNTETCPAGSGAGTRLCRNKCLCLGDPEPGSFPRASSPALQKHSALSSCFCRNSQPWQQLQSPSGSQEQERLFFYPRQGVRQVVKLHQSTQRGHQASCVRGTEPSVLHQACGASSLALLQPMIQALLPGGDDFVVSSQPCPHHAGDGCFLLAQRMSSAIPDGAGPPACQAGRAGCSFSLHAWEQPTPALSISRLPQVIQGLGSRAEHLCSPRSPSDPAGTSGSRGQGR